MAYRTQAILVVALLLGLGTLGASAAVDSLGVHVQSQVVSSAFDCSTAQDVPEPECQALVNFYNATDGDNWITNFDWLKDSLVCTWRGVNCTILGDRHHVTFLDQHDNNLSGTLPGQDLAKLEKLEFLKLSQNNLTGPIPSELGQLEFLSTLVLGTNELTGTIPFELAELPNLTLLRLPNNKLTGPIPEALMGLCVDCPTNGNYGQLNLFGNNLEGELPADIGRTDISTLDFRNNPNLTGPIPDSYVILKHVSFFGYSVTDICTPTDFEIQAWLANIQTVLDSGLVCPESYSISGYVLHLDGLPFLGSPIILAVEGSDLIGETESDGYYEITELPAGTHTVFPDDPDLEFMPVSQEVTVPPDAENIDFSGRWSGYSIASGRITDEADQPIFGVRLEKNPPTENPFNDTDREGKYVIDLLQARRYEIKAISTVFKFTPASYIVSVPPDVTGLDFTGTRLSFKPAVSASGPGFELNGLALDPDPDSSSPLALRDQLRYSCSPSQSSQAGPCTFPQATLALEAVEVTRRCELVNLTALLPAEATTAGYQAWLEVVELPDSDVCHPGSRTAFAPLDANAAMTLTVAAGEEGFIYNAAQSPMTLAVNSDVTAVVGTGKKAFSVRHQPGSGETTVAAYSGPVELTPANPTLTPFTLAQGQRVTVSSDAITFLPPLDLVLLPVVSKASG